MRRFLREYVTIKAFFIVTCAIGYLWIWKGPHIWSPNHMWAGKALFWYTVIAFWGGIIAESKKEQRERRHDEKVRELVKRPDVRFAQNDRNN